MIRVDTDQDKIDLSLPIDLEEENEYNSSRYNDSSPKLFLDKSSNASNAT